MSLFRSPTLLCLVLVAAAPVTSLAWADSPPSASTSAPDEGALRKQAEADAAAGKSAMRDADADPKKAVDAAIAFSRALHAYDKLQDTDMICEMQADIFWCKKKMNLADLQDYLARKGAEEKRDFSSAQEVMNKTVPVSEAGSYLERADRYRGAHPDDHFQNAIFYSEIVERFPDTDQARLASKVFDHEQAQYLVQVSKEREAEHKQLENEIAQVRKNRFQEPPPVAAGSQSPLPDREAITAAVATVRKTYAADYGKARKPNQKRALARKLASEAEQSKDDAAAYFAILQESERLAGESEDYETILTDIEHLAATFTGFDGLQAKKDAMRRLASRTTASNILKLLQDPTDKGANLVVGKFYCFDLGRWEDGLKMLSLGSDPDYHKVAELELNGPKNSEEDKILGDTWYAIGKKGSSSDRLGTYARAQHWYLEAMPGMSGMNKTATQTRLDEIERVLPAVITDWNNVTQKQWDHLRGQIMIVEARRDRSDTGITLGPDEKVRLIAAPTDVWHWNIEGDDFDCGANGHMPHATHTSTSGGSAGSGGNGGYAGGWDAGEAYSFGKFRQGQLTMKVNNDGAEQALGIAVGPGHVFLQPHNTWGMLGTGQLRIKIVPVQDE